jgi:hypothetical protein
MSTITVSTNDALEVDAKTQMTQPVDSIVFSIISQFVERSKIGKEKYGTTLDREDLSILEWIQHAQEEHMDAILYLEKLKKEYMKSK